MAEYDSTICNCGCGLPVSVGHDPNQFFIVEDETCYARRAIEKVRAEKREQAKQAKKGDGWDAGLKLYARPVTREEALAHVAAKEQAKESGEVGPRMAAARAQREKRDERQNRRLGAKA